MQPLESHATRMKQILGIETEPIAVFLLQTAAADPTFGSFEKVTAHRYCQVLMRARRGESLLLEPAELACPAAAAAFGFRPLPQTLATGKGLVGFGIVAEPATGRAMFDGMTRLREGSLSAVAVCPLGAAPAQPEVVVVEGRPESLMWLALADLNRAGGERRRGDTAVVQATCVDATVIPHVEHRLNFSLGCYGCREATDLGAEETVLGLPGEHLEEIVANLERLNHKAVGRSRAKEALRRLTGGERAKEHPGAQAGNLPRVVLPELSGDIVIKLSPEDVTRAFRAVMDDDPKEAFDLVRDRIYRAVREVLERPRCAPAFEVKSKLSDGG